MSVGLGTITVPIVGRPASTRSCVLLVVSCQFGCRAGRPCPPYHSVHIRRLS